MAAPTRYQIFKAMSTGKTIRETHELVHKMWNTALLDDCDEVDSTGDAVLKYLLEQPFKPERDHYEEVQPHIQLDEMLSEFLGMVTVIKKNRSDEGVLSVDGTRALDVLEWNIKGLMKGNRFCKHPQQKIIKYL